MEVVFGPFDYRYLLGKVLVQIFLNLFHLLNSQIFWLAEPTSVLLLFFINDPLLLFFLKIFSDSFGKVVSVQHLKDVL
jgi:hypothetical protein